MNIPSISTVRTVVVRGGHRGLLLTKKHSPVILTTTGIVGGVVSAVMGAKATLKLEEIIDDTHTNVELAKLEDVSNKKAIGLEYAKGGLRVAKLYAPAVGLGASSIVCIVSAQSIMQKRNVAMVAAYTTLEKGFNEYRKRVENELGVDKERELRYDLTDLGTKTDDGETEYKTSLAKTLDHSIYARFFDEGNANWNKQPELNKLFIKCQQNYANDLLRGRGHVFLNEVYDMLGMDRSRAGAVMGWVMGGDGDNFIDFGVFNANSERARAFVNGEERSILLDFNVDGVIYDQI